MSNNSKLFLEVGKTLLSTTPQTSDVELEESSETCDETSSRDRIPSKEKSTKLDNGQSQCRKQSELCLRNALTTSFSDTPASSSTPACDEALVVQNADLQRKLQILQRGVVESMKGNKARFMGSGAFKQAKGDTSARHQMPSLTASSDSYDTIRTAFDKKKAQLEESEIQVELLKQEAEMKNRQMAELEQSLEELRAEALLADQAERQASSEREKRKKVEDLLQDAQARSKALEEQLRNQNDWDDLEQELDASKAREKQISIERDLLYDTIENERALFEDEKLGFERLLQEQTGKIEDGVNSMACIKQELQDCQLRLEDLGFDCESERARHARSKTVLQACRNGLLRDADMESVRTIMATWRMACDLAKRERAEKEAESKLAKKEADLVEAVGKIAALQGAYDQSCTTERELEKKLELLETQCREFRLGESDKDKQLLEKDKRLLEQENLLMEKGNLLAQLEQELADYKKEVSDKERADLLLRAREESGDESYRRREQTLLKEIAESEKERESMQRQITTLTKERSQLKKKIVEVEKETARAQKEAANRLKQMKIDAELRKTLEDKIAMLEKEKALSDENKLKEKDAE